ncbi:O-acetylserine/cysteine efflux transporter [Deinobacterium chartae]|uniref:O-acetylserine/cysteine efflux transporter n=1 Tax=Deinobacterium chartae TaxID=521158 RepID=A0A841I6H9_9DEIO|nr:EamA family transporter [Deinobacterium chartae]MBB6099502.1 O-acetylserine/cysteine efflux transporter [Deinobacterium chartae]
MTPRDLLLALLVVAIWGVNFVVIKVGLHDVPPLLLVALRFVLAALPAVFFVRRPPMPFRYIVGYGLVLGVAHFGLLFWGLQNGVSAGMGSLVLQLQAFFTALLGLTLLREKVLPRQWLGMAIAFAGIAVIATIRDESVQPLGLAVLVLSAAMWGAANIISKRAGQIARFDMLSFVVWTSLIPPLPLLGLSLALEGPERIVQALTQLTPSALGAALYIAYLSTLLGFGVWTWLLSRYPASSVAPLSLLVPVFGMSSSALLLGESFGPYKLLGAALVVVGLLVNVFGDRLRPLRLRPAPQGD